MEDYTKYSLEGACSLFISVLAYRLYKMRCNSSSKCCGDNIEADFHNDGGQLDTHFQNDRGERELAIIEDTQV